MTARDERNDGLLERVNRLTRDLAELRTMVLGRLPGATGGPGAGFLIRDDNDNLVMRQGRLASPPYTNDYGYGLDVRDADGVQIVFSSTLTGMTRPRAVGLTQDSTLSKTITAGAFTSTNWLIYWPLITCPGIEVQIPFTVDAGTTGELRVVSNLPSNTDAYAISTSGIAVVDWLHGIDNGLQQAGFTIEARRTSGVGNVKVFTPVAWHFDPTNCTSGGIWELFT